MEGTRALALLAAVALLFAAGSDAQRRAWALFAIAGVALFLALRAVPELVPGPRLLGVHWNWSGYLLALAGMLGLGWLLIERTRLPATALGFAAPRAIGVAAAVTVAALLLVAASNATGQRRLAELPAETWMFMAAMPGLAEEVAFRGVLLAAAERAAPAARSIAGASISVGALILTLAFVALHGITYGTLVSVLPASLLYLWLRQRTGSMLVPIVAHNLWNLTVLAARL